jgi:hypothetical protein
VLEAQFLAERCILMFLDTERLGSPSSRAVGRLGAAGVGGGAGVVGRRRCHGGCGGSRLADAPLLSTSGRYVLVEYRFLKGKVNMF